ncbi:unnamed protein product [Ixodes hexagonus]
MFSKTKSAKAPTMRRSMTSWSMKTTLRDTSRFFTMLSMVRK